MEIRISQGNLSHVTLPAFLVTLALKIAIPTRAGRKLDDRSQYEHCLVL